jgi:hypothetical protein
MNTQKPFAESGTSPPLRVTVTCVEITPGCATATALGIDPDGIEVAFGVDWRPALALANAVRSGRVVEVFLHDGRVVCWTAGGPRP